MSRERDNEPKGNLSVAWAEAFLRVLDAAGGELDEPLVISISDFDGALQPVECAEIRDALDDEIARINVSRSRKRGSLVQSVSATASTIFPQMCWSPAVPRPASELFDHYISRVYPRLTKLCRLNARGTYFLRMIQSTGVAPDGVAVEPVNQLDDIISWWKRDSQRGARTRRSAMQVGIYDPAKDHNGSARSVFPCLQQLSFGYSTRGLSVSAYYATEYIFDRGYGNYLGLCHLGGFMAHELKIPLDRVSVFVALAELGSVRKRDVMNLAETLKRSVLPLAGAPRT